MRDYHDQLVQHKDYQQMLHDIERDKSKFSKVKGIISGKICLQGIVEDLFISHEIHHIFVNNWLLKSILR